RSVKIGAPTLLCRERPAVGAKQKRPPLSWRAFPSLQAKAWLLLFGGLGRGLFGGGLGRLLLGRLGLEEGGRLFSGAPGGLGRLLCRALGLGDQRAALGEEL